LTLATQFANINILFECNQNSITNNGADTDFEANWEDRRIFAQVLEKSESLCVSSVVHHLFNPDHAYFIFRQLKMSSDLPVAEIACYSADFDCSEEQCYYPTAMILTGERPGVQGCALCPRPAGHSQGKALHSACLSESMLYGTKQEWYKDDTEKHAEAHRTEKKICLAAI